MTRPESEKGFWEFWASIKGLIPKSQRIELLAAKIIRGDIDPSYADDGADIEENEEFAAAVNLVDAAHGADQVIGVHSQGPRLKFNTYKNQYTVQRLWGGYVWRNRAWVWEPVTAIEEGDLIIPFMWRKTDC
jgi:hypothetical protein